MPSMIDAAIQDPYRVLQLVLGDTLHPGGEKATRELLDRAGVGPGTRLVDLGCGPGVAIELARELGATTLGVDASPAAGGASVCADLAHLPLGDGTADVVLSECAVCLAEDLDEALDEIARVLVPGGRLALSDVTLTRELPSLPGPVARALCLDGERHPDRLVQAVEVHGFEITSRGDHHADLVAMRDELASKLDYRGLLTALGPAGAGLLGGVDEIEAALEDRTLGYVSIVAQL